MKPRYDNILSRLSEDEQARVHDWLITLGYTKTLEKLAQPRPEGLDIRTHRSCLHRFYKRYQDQARTEDLSAAKENWPISNDDASVLVSDAEQSFLHAAHQLATGPMDSSDFSKVGHWLESRKDQMYKRFHIHIAEQNAAIAQRKATLAERRLEFDFQKFRFNAARMALVHFAELAKIARNRNADDEAKIKAAADLLFQPLQNRGSTDPNLNPNLNPNLASPDK